MEDIKDKERHTCSFCNKDYKFKCHMLRHMRTHSTSGAQRTRQFHCQHCDKKYFCKSDLKRHMEKHTGQHSFRCDVCGNQFSHRTAFTNHVRTHTDERPFTCGDCGNTFRCRSTLIAHMRNIHFGTPEWKRANLKGFKRRRHPCPHCHKSFSPNSLNRHINDVHKRVKHYSCHLCDMTFARKYTVSCHIEQIHLKSKKASCTICGEAFSGKRELNHHLHAHRGEIPLMCRKCAYISKDKDDLSKHMNINHNKQGEKRTQMTNELVNEDVKHEPDSYNQNQNDNVDEDDDDDTGEEGNHDEDGEDDHHGEDEDDNYDKDGEEDNHDEDDHHGEDDNYDEDGEGENHDEEDHKEFCFQNDDDGLESYHKVRNGSLFNEKEDCDNKSALDLNEEILPHPNIKNSEIDSNTSVKAECSPSDLVDQNSVLCSTNMKVKSYHVKNEEEANSHIKQEFD